MRVNLTTQIRVFFWLNPDFNPVGEGIINTPPCILHLEFVYCPKSIATVLEKWVKIPCVLRHAFVLLLCLKPDDGIVNLSWERFEALTKSLIKSPVCPLLLTMGFVPKTMLNYPHWSNKVTPNESLHTKGRPFRWRISISLWYLSLSAPNQLNYKLPYIDCLLSNTMTFKPHTTGTSLHGNRYPTVFDHGGRIGLQTVASLCDNSRLYSSLRYTEVFFFFSERGTKFKRFQVETTQRKNNKRPCHFNRRLERNK